MRHPPAHGLETRPSPATLLLVTVLLVLMLGALTMLAAHHVQTAQGETSHAVLAEFDTSPQVLAGNDRSSEVAGEHIMAGLATGCIVLIVCCALGLALLSARAWRADLFRRLITVAKRLHAVVATRPTALPSAARPNLVALSISRT